MDLEPGGQCGEKFEGAAQRREPRRGLRNWRCPCGGANFIGCSTMVGKHFIIFVRQMCHREADKQV